MEKVALLKELKRIAIDLTKKDDWGANSIKVNKKIIEVDNKCSAAYTRLAKCYSEDGNDEEALNLYEKVLLFDKTNLIAKNRIEDHNRVTTVKAKPEKKVKSVKKTK